MDNQKKVWDNEYSQNKNKWHKETTSLPTIKRSAKVLELGVGNGKTLKAILKHKPKEVTAIDFCKEAINLAKSNTLFKNIKFIKTDVRELPFKDNYFEIVVCYYTLNNLIEKDRIKAVSEIHRVLKPKGKIFFQDFAVGDFRQKEKNKAVEDNTIQNKSGIICHFSTKRELNILFKEFSNIKITTKITKPITHKPKLKRKILSGIISK